MVCHQIATYSTVQNVLKKGDLVMCAQFQAGCSPDLALLGTSKPSCWTPTPPPFRLTSVTRGLQSVMPLLEHFTQPLSASVFETCSKQEKGDFQLWPPLNRYTHAQGVKTRIANLVQVTLWLSVSYLQLSMSWLKILNLSGIVNCVTVCYYTMSLNCSQRSQKVREDLLYYLWLARAKKSG